MTDTKPFTTPADAVACLRTYLGGKGLAEYEAAWAALESLEAALSTERESNTANMAELHRADARIGEQAARIRALESELDEKTARVVLPTREAIATAAFEANRGRPWEPPFPFEQAAETEEQAAERLAEALWALDAAETGYRWSERNDDTKRFWRERARLVREALRLAKEADNAD